ncbi:MAG: F0F1 ATP synthase subunit A [Culicoidibacterales bacterium]
MNMMLTTAVKEGLTIGNFTIGPEMFYGWAAMLIIIGLGLLGRKYLNQLDPSGKPPKFIIICEQLLSFFDGTVATNPYRRTIGPMLSTLFIYLLLINTLSLWGLRPAAYDLSIALSLGLLTFIIMHSLSFKTYGAKGYFKQYMKPFGFMLPLNMISFATESVTISLRLFGNMVAGTVLAEVLRALITPLGYFIPGVALSFYLDIFSGTIQALVFTMLTAILISSRTE